MKGSPLHHAATVISAMFLLAATIFIIIRWSQIPETVPSHYDIIGNVDGYSGKIALIWELGIAWGILILLTVIERFPGLWNLPVKVTPQNKNKLYLITRTMMGGIKLLIALLFTCTLLFSALAKALPPWIMPLLMAAIFITIGGCIFAMIRNR